MPTALGAVQTGCVLRMSSRFCWLQALDEDEPLRRPLLVGLLFQGRQSGLLYG